MKRMNEGSMLVWVLVILAVLSMVVVVYARMINLDYQIGISQYKQQCARESAFSGLAVAQQYFGANQSEVLTFYNRYPSGTADEAELYPNRNSLFTGLSTQQIDLLSDLSVTRILLVEDTAGTVWLRAEGSFNQAACTLSQQVTDLAGSIKFSTVIR